MGGSLNKVMTNDKVAACYAPECPAPQWCRRGILAKGRLPQFGDFTEASVIEIPDGMNSTTCANFLPINEGGAA